MEVGRSWICRCYPAPALSCTLGLLTANMGGDAGQVLRCPQCLQAEVRDAKKGPRCGTTHSLPPGTADPVSWSGLLTRGSAGNAPALPGQGLCTAINMASWGRGLPPCQGPHIPAQGLPQRSNARACSSPALLGPSFQETCWVSTESRVAMAKLSTEHYHPSVFSPPGPCSACSQAVKWPSSGTQEAADESPARAQPP